MFDIMDYKFIDKENIKQHETNSIRSFPVPFKSEDDFDNYLMSGFDKNEMSVIEIYMKEDTDYCRISKNDVIAMAKHFDIKLACV